MLKFRLTLLASCVANVAFGQVIFQLISTDESINGQYLIASQPYNEENDILLTPGPIGSALDFIVNPQGGPIQRTVGLGPNPNEGFFATDPSNPESESVLLLAFGVESSDAVTFSINADDYLLYSGINNWFICPGLQPSPPEPVPVLAFFDAEVTVESCTEVTLLATSTEPPTTTEDTTTATEEPPTTTEDTTTATEEPPTTTEDTTTTTDSVSTTTDDTTTTTDSASTTTIESSASTEETTSSDSSSASETSVSTSVSSSTTTTTTTTTSSSSVATPSGQLSIDAAISIQISGQGVSQFLNIAGNFAVASSNRLPFFLRNGQLFLDISFSAQLARRQTSPSDLRLDFAQSSGTAPLLVNVDGIDAVFSVNGNRLLVNGRNDWVICQSESLNGETFQAVIEFAFSGSVPSTCGPVALTVSPFGSGDTIITCVSCTINIIVIPGCSECVVTQINAPVVVDCVVCANAQQTVYVPVACNTCVNAPVVTATVTAGGAYATAVSSSGSGTNGGSSSGGSGGSSSGGSSGGGSTGGNSGSGSSSSGSGGSGTGQSSPSQTFAVAQQPENSAAKVMNNAWIAFLGYFWVLFF